MFIELHNIRDTPWLCNIDHIQLISIEDDMTVIHFSGDENHYIVKEPYHKILSIISDYRLMGIIK